MTSDQKAQAMVDAFKPLTSVEPPVAQNGWQPIETAPKDGTQLLLWSNRPTVGAYGQRYQNWFTIPGEYTCRPTHWMPLPEPPTP